MTKGTRLEGAQWRLSARDEEGLRDCCGCGDGGRSCREEKRFGGKGGKSWSLTENRTAVGAMTRVGDERGQV